MEDRWPMADRIIPIFPLPLVQFPGALTPLHIFEPRYRKLLDDIMKTDKTLGITCRSEEQDQALEPPPGSIGCMVEVVAMQGLPDGRSNIVCLGKSRYRTLEYLEGEPYLQAKVEPFEDDAAEEGEHLEKLAESVGTFFQRAVRAVQTMKELTTRQLEAPELPADPQGLSFIVASTLEIKLEEKQELLEMTDTGERLRRLAAVLTDLAPEYERRAELHTLSRLNGHAGHLPSE
jgi:Lon protease-like protein